MSQMKALFELVSKDATLRAQLSKIMKDAEKAGDDTTREKLIAFAKDTGYDITLEEMQLFFKNLSKNMEGELSDAELDMVAGGKLDMTQHRDILA